MRVAERDLRALSAPLLTGEIVVNREGRTLVNVLQSIAEGYLRGTPNGIRQRRALLHEVVLQQRRFLSAGKDHAPDEGRRGYRITDRRTNEL